jgi:signal transduction histidine kinase
MAVLDVVNTGPPIGPAEQKRIFDRFYRVDKARSNKTPGAGLGLALAKEITRAHKGHLSVNTDPERGLITFTLRLPCAT